jgi:hypothetical protein
MVNCQADLNLGPNPEFLDRIKNVMPMDENQNGKDDI